MGYEDFFKRKESVPPNYELVGGGFECSFCRYVNLEAKYYSATRQLRWTCDQCTETNVVGDFNLD